MDQLGNEMLVDPDYDDKQDVAIISPDDADDNMDEVDSKPEPRADDFEAIKKRYLVDLVEAETEDEAIHTWNIEDWKNLSKKEHGPVFECGGHKWRILFFPWGNNVEHASFYLEQGFDDKPPEDWYACVQFVLVLWNPNDPTMLIPHHAHHRFTAEEGDWGFTRFAELRRLFAPSWDGRNRPMVENNAANVTAYVRVLKDPTGVLWHNFINYDSKKETGLVGLKNQGATCYLNSLLQSLYFTTAFRKAVYQIPTEHEAERLNSAYALQRLFYQLQTSNTAVATNELTESFGWDTKQIFEQQDVQELSRILMARLEEKMKGTEAENSLSDMFAGKEKTYLSCINVDYESSVPGVFWDVQLNVRGLKNLDESFRDYIKEEIMDGDNKYFAEGYGLQDAKKGVIFESFPSVLHLQLKRFEYDVDRDAQMKINDRHEFPEVWDASPYLSKDADQSEPWIYHLHGVLVHSGDLNAGHYYAFLKPNKNGEFYKFDDDRVTRATKRESLEENFGGDYTNANGQRNPYTRTWSAKRSMSAYMLVYIRESRLDRTLLSEEDVLPPAHLAQRLAEERAAIEKRKRDREEAHLYMEAHVATLKNFTAYQGYDIVPWKSDKGGDTLPKAYRILRSTTVAEFTDQVAEDLVLNPKMIRPWVMVNRQNGTVRPDQPITLLDLSMEEAMAKYGTKTSHFRLWIETTDEEDKLGEPIFGDAHVDLHGVAINKPVMLFLKHFDHEAQSLRGVGCFYAAWQDRVIDISPQILNLLKWPAGTGFKLYEEIKQNMIEPIKPKITLAASEIQDGDIITVQKVLSDKETNALTSTGSYTETREFYEYLINKIQVTFTPKFTTESEEATFTLTLSKKMTYDQFSAKVGEYLGVDPTHIRFSTVNANTGRSKLPVKRTMNLTLSNVLVTPSYAYGPTQPPRSDMLMYEVLELSLSELETRKNVKITWLPEGLTREEHCDVLVAKNGNITDLLEGLAKKTNLETDALSNLRVYDVQAYRLIRTLPAEHPVLSLNEHSPIYAEKIPEDELAEEQPHHIHAFHFEKETNKTHSIPFIFLLKEGELFKETKERISQRTGIKGKQFERIKFYLVPKGHYTKPELLEDDSDLWELMNTREDCQLGLDHPNKNKNSWAKGESMFIR